MPQIVKLDDFTQSDTTQNKYCKFEKANFKKVIKLEDINKNGLIKMEYDINNNPFLEIKSNNKSVVLTNESVKADIGIFNKLKIKNTDFEKIIQELSIKINYLEDRVKELEDCKKITKMEIKEDFCESLYLIDFENPFIGLLGVFKLNDGKEYLYICYYVDKSVSYWKLINNIEF